MANKPKTKTVKNTRKNSGLRPPWKPGESGNPKGRPKKGNAWADIANELLGAKEIKFSLSINGKRKRTIHLSTDITMRHLIIASQIEAAVNGDVPAARELADRTEGKPVPINPGQTGIVDLNELAEVLKWSYEERKPK